jgi:hypothetical protein
MERRFGPEAVEIDRTDARYARVQVRPDLTVEVGFAGVFRMFGALIDTQWVARRGSPSDGTEVSYRFDLQTFVGKSREARRLAERLSDVHATTLARRSELKSIRVLDGPAGRLVEITPLPGTITAMYLPPLPPYSVPIRPTEADDQLELLLHLVDRE